MRTTFRILLALALLIGLGWLCSYQVAETEYAILARFGDPREVKTEGGLYLKWPAPIEAVQLIDRRRQVLDPGPSEYLTSDKKNVLVSCFMVWSVHDPLRFVLSVGDLRVAEARLADILRSEVGSVLGSYPLTALVSDTPQDTTIQDVMADITAHAAPKARDSFGIEIAAIRVKRLNFPTQNKQAVFRRMEAERQRIAKLIRSEGEEEAEKLRADANRTRAEILSEAQRQAEERRGEADAEATRIYADAFGQDPEFYEFMRSLEVYRRIMGEGSTIVVPHDAEILKALQHSTPPTKTGEAED